VRASRDREGGLTDQIEKLEIKLKNYSTANSSPKSLKKFTLFVLAVDVEF
jgi:hypothetical protein